jgi:succinate dehydrogenase/fumarate reductase flavoprotein subunit
MTNGLCDWRADTDLLNAYVDNSEEALMWYLNRAGLTDETEYGDGSKVDSNTDCTALLHNDDKGLNAYMCTSEDLTGVWQDRMDTYDFGEDHCYFFAPWIGPKPNNVGTVLTEVLANVQAKCPNLETFFSTPAVKLVMDGDKVTGVIGKTEDGKYIQFNASKGVILATGDYQNNQPMVERWCPDVDGYDKKQYQKTGDGHVLAISAGAQMEKLGHTKMMHDFDSGLMYEEPYLYVDMEGKRFCNEDTGFVYMGNVIKYSPRFNGDNVDANHPDGSLGWYCQIYDNDYMGYANSPVPETVMTKYIPGAVENPQGVFTNLIDTHKADTLEELADALGIPADTLKQSVERYNALCEQGFDEDFGKSQKYMHKIETAPFWGIRKHIRVSAICAGVNTNANAQALDADGKVIDGLYCVGNLGGVFYGSADYPFHQTGLSLGRCYTFGMIAAKHALGKL